ncbi:hypothetical protein P7C70_g3220, partial [Phenoliferia sp. Uapishka_3]
MPTAEQSNRRRQKACANDPIVVDPFADDEQCAYRARWFGSGRAMQAHGVVCERAQEAVGFRMEYDKGLAAAIAEMQARDNDEDSDGDVEMAAPQLPAQIPRQNRSQSQSPPPGEDGDVEWRSEPTNTFHLTVQQGDVEMEENDFGGGEEQYGFTSDRPSARAILVEHPTMGTLLFERHPNAPNNDLPTPPNVPRPPEPLHPPSSASYAPYAIRSDYLIGVFAITECLSYGCMDHLFKLLRHPELVLKEVQNKSSKNLRKDLGEIEKLGGEAIEVRSIDIMKAIRTIVGSTELAPHLKLYPERWFRVIPGEPPERIIDEFMTADNSWDYFKDHGDWGKHQLPLVCSVAEPDGCELLDLRSKAMTSWPDLHQFNTSGISKPTFADGNWYRDILRFMPEILDNIFPEAVQETMERLIRATVVHRLFQGLDVHTPEKLVEMEEWIGKQELTYKREADHHTATGCREKGATIGTSTKEGESLHPRHHAAFQLTNGKEYMGQMIERMSLEDKELVIDGRVQRDAVESKRLLLMPKPHDFDTASTDLARFRFHCETQPIGIEIGSPRKLLEVDKWLADPQRAGDPQFNDLETGLRFFFHSEVDNHPPTRVLNRARHLHSRTIIDYGVVKATYSSLDDYRTDIDRLVVNSSFHGHKREDAVLVTGPEGEQWFYRLIAVIEIDRDDITHTLAYG